MWIYKNGHWFLWIANSRLQIGDLNVGYSGDLNTGTPCGDAKNPCIHDFSNNDDI